MRYIIFYLRVFNANVLSFQKVLSSSGCAARRWPMYIPIRRSLQAWPELDNTFWTVSSNPLGIARFEGVTRWKCSFCIVELNDAPATIQQSAVLQKNDFRRKKKTKKKKRWKAQQTKLEAFKNNNSYECSPTQKEIFSYWEDIPFPHNSHINPRTARVFILKREDFESPFERNPSEIAVLLEFAPSEVIPLKLRGIKRRK